MQSGRAHAIRRIWRVSEPCCRRRIFNQRSTVISCEMAGEAHFRRFRLVGRTYLPGNASELPWRFLVETVVRYGGVIRLIAERLGTIGPYGATLGSPFFGLQISRLVSMQLQRSFDSRFRKRQVILQRRLQRRLCIRFAGRWSPFQPGFLFSTLKANGGNCHAFSMSQLQQRGRYGRGRTSPGRHNK